jgi:hypothetical protein
MKILHLYSEANSLSEVISTDPLWLMATAKAKAVAGIVQSLRFVHSFGLVHGHLDSTNIVFDVDHQIQITNLYVNALEDEGMANGRDVFLGDGCSLDRDIRGFASILFEIIVSHLMMVSDVLSDEQISGKDIPVFVSNLIASEQSPECRIGQSVHDMFDILSDNNFEIMSVVDSMDVSAFAD